MGQAVFIETTATTTPEQAEPRADHGRPRSIGYGEVPLRVPWRTVLLVGVYFAVALAANWPTWPGDPWRARTVTNFGVIGSTDFDLGIWFLAWTPHALLHGLNPFYTTVLNYPRGVNLAENTTSPLLGLLAAPLTLAVSPIASMNLLMWLAFPLSATTMFFVLRRFVAWDLAAFAGGALYGFSPWVVTQDQYHLNLCFVPLPPLILLCVYRLLRPDEPRPVRWGLLLGSMVVAQFLISVEICTLTMLFAVIAALCAAVRWPRRVWRCVRHAAKGGVCAVGLAACVLAYPIELMYQGPYHFVGPPTPGGEGTDLLNPILPTHLQLVSLGHLGVIGSNLVFGNTSENGGYLGLPLLLLLAVIAVAYRKRPLVPLSALLMAVAFVLSLGSHLDVDNHRTSFPLPFDLVQWRPVFENIVQVRIGLFVVLFAAMLLACGIDEFHGRRIARRDAPPQGTAKQTKTNSANGHRPWVDYGFASWVEPTYRRAVAPWATPAHRRLAKAIQAVCGRLKPALRPFPVLLGALAVVTLIPHFPLPTSPVEVPTYFSSSAVAEIPSGSVVLISPYPSVFDPVAQVWQAVAQERFSIIGGYALFPSGPAGYPAPYPPPLKPRDVQMFLTGEADGWPFLSGTIPPVSLQLDCDFRTFLVRHQVDTVIEGPIPRSFRAHPESIGLLFSLALGNSSAVDGSVRAWYGVRARIAANGPLLPCP